jgi:hypothetical protein
VEGYSVSVTQESDMAHFVEFDHDNGLVKVFGVHYSADMFSVLSFAKPGDRFEVVSGAHGALTIRRLPSLTSTGNED